MHNGSLQTLEDVIEHYSHIDMDRLHTDGELILKPLNLSNQDARDLVRFLETLGRQ
jgi:cytochrome c peroxidase